MHSGTLESRNQAITDVAARAMWSRIQADSHIRYYNHEMNNIQPNSFDGTGCCNIGSAM